MQVPRYPQLNLKLTRVKERVHCFCTNALYSKYNGKIITDCILHTNTKPLNDVKKGV